MSISNPSAGTVRRAGIGRRRTEAPENYFSPEWLLLGATYVTMVALFFLFTPYTHQLDEIKNLILGILPPLLLLSAVLLANFRKMSWPVHGSTFFLGLWVVAMITSYLLNSHKDTGERVVWFQLASAAFTVVFAWFMDSESKMRKTLMVLVLIALGSTVVGLFMFAGQGFTGLIYDYLVRSARTGGMLSQDVRWVTLFYTLKESKEMYSTILNSDFFAAFLVMTIPFALSMFFVEEHLSFKILAIVTFLLMNVCLFFTNSNDSFLSIILITYPLYAILGYLYMQNWGLTKRFLGAFLACSGILLGTVGLLMMPTLAQTWEFKSEAFSGREILWAGAYLPWLYGEDRSMSGINIMSFLFGTGPGGYRFYFPLFRADNFFDNQINNVTTFGHNWYLDILCEFGLFGLIAFGAFHIKVIADGFWQIRNSENNAHKFYQLACICGLMGIALQNVFSPNNRWAVCSMIYWTIFGLSMGIYHLDRPGQEEERERMWPKVARPLLIVFVAFFALRSGYLSYNYWIAATSNSVGLGHMDDADRTQGAQKTMYLQASKEHFLKAIQHNPTFATSYYKLGHVLNQMSDIEGAIRVYERLNEVFPHYSEIHLNLGIMYNVQSRAETDPDKKLELLEKSWEYMQEASRQSIKANIRWISGLVGEELAREYKTRGREEEGIEVLKETVPFYQSILDYEPKLPEVIADKRRYYAPAKERLAEIMFEINDLVGAEAILKRTYLEDPNNRVALNQLLRVFDRRSAPEEKVDFLRRATDAAPLNVPLRLDLAGAYFAAGDFAKYEQELRKVLVAEPGNQEALAQLYLLNNALNEPEQARAFGDELTSAGLNLERLGKWSENDLKSTTTLARVPVMLRMAARPTTATDELQPREAAPPPVAPSATSPTVEAAPTTAASPVVPADTTTASGETR